jgi:hypothetical protein
VLEAELEEKELDVIDLLASQGQEDDHDEDIDYSEELPTDPEDLKALILKEREIKSKRNKSLKKSKQANHRMQEELEALQRTVEELKNSSQPSTGANDKEREEALEAWRESAVDNPAAGIDYTNERIKQLEGNIVGALSSMQEQIEARLSKSISEVDPERIKYRAKVEQLRMNPEFADMDENALLKFAKAMETIRVPRGGVGGKKATVTTDPESEYKSARERYAKILRSGIGG